MRLFDSDDVPCYLDHIAHRVAPEKNEETETKIVDLTLRVELFTPDLATAVHPDVRALLFTKAGQPKPMIKALEFTMPVPRQRLTVRPIQHEDLGACCLTDVAIAKTRVRTEKNLADFAFLCRASLEVMEPNDLAWICAWLAEVRFVTFDPAHPEFDFEADVPEVTHAHR